MHPGQTFRDVGSPKADSGKTCTLCTAKLGEAGANVLFSGRKGALYMQSVLFCITSFFLVSGVSRLLVDHCASVDTPTHVHRVSLTGAINGCRGATGKPKVSFPDIPDIPGYSEFMRGRGELTWKLPVGAENHF